MASSGRKRSLSEPCTSTPSKCKKYVCKYQHFWEKEFMWLKKSDTGVGEKLFLPEVLIFANIFLAF
jgi:hypothetical protein